MRPPERGRSENGDYRVVKGFADFAEPFCAGWNAHRAHGDASPETFTKALMEAFENSGSQRALRVFEAMKVARDDAT